MKKSNIAEILVTVTLMVLVVSVSVSAQEIPRGGTLTAVLVAEPRVLTPETGAWNAGFVAAQIFNSLLTLDKDLNIVPCLAERWEINEQDQSYTFYLRKNAKWHDGEPFTAADVKFSFEEILSKYDIFGALYFEGAKVDIIDDYTVKVKFNKFLPAAQLKLMASIDAAMFPKHILEGQDFLKSEFRSKPIGTGPFKFKEWVKGSHIILERNDDYWAEGKPYLDELVIRIIPDPGTILASFERGEIDYVFRGVPYETYDRLSKMEEAEVLLSARPPYKLFLSINQKHPILSNKKVRQAIAYAIDRDDIIARATNGLAKPTDSFWSPELTPPSPNRKIYNYDPAKAEKLLDEAGYPRGADGKRFSIEILCRRGEAEENLAAELIKDQLSEVGIEVKLKIADFATVLDLESHYQYDIELYKRWLEPLWTYQLLHSSWIRPGEPFTNTVQYNNSKVDELLDKWLAEPDPDRQVEILQQVEDIVTDELPEIPVYDVVFINLKRKSFQGPDIPVGKYVFWDSLENMYWTKGEVARPMWTTETMVIVGVGIIVAVIVAGIVFMVMRRRR